ncbi:MAG: redoxin family protein [Burkholderiales bacterium]|nr:redoxin family protein [Burkholderiales bacterium]
MNAKKLFLPLLAVLGSLLASVPADASPPRVGEPMPEFPAVGPAGWLNSPPLRLAGLRGKVVLVEFWTYGCSNCRNTLPWLKQAAERYRDDGLVVVAVHTPEFPAERVRGNVVRALQPLGITHPVLLDPDSVYWNAMGNRYWPAFWLVDRQGRLAATAIGELHSGEARTRNFEGKLRELLGEPALVTR